MNRGFLSVGPLTVIVIIGIVILMILPFYAIMASQRSSTRRAIYYTSKLRDAIDSVCEGSSAKTITFNIDQNMPNDLLKGAYITTRGDPDVVVYYEAFHPGTGYSWEGYYGELPKNILFVYVNSTNDEFDKSYIKDFIERSEHEANETLKSLNVRTAIPMFYPVVANVQDSNWKAVKQFGRVKYYIKNATESQDRMIYKYEFCMNNSICMKTKNAIYAFPLKCDFNGSVLFDTDQGATGEYYGELSLASPCKGEVTVYSAKCSCEVHKKYIINNSKIEYIGNYTTCEKDDNGDRTCIIVDITNANGFCEQLPCQSNCLLAQLPIVENNYTIMRYDTFANDSGAFGYEKW